MGKNILITTDCTSDLDPEVIDRYDIRLLYFYIKTDTGVFRDVDEISSYNVIECMENNRPVQSSAPPVDEYESFFRKCLEDNEEIIHITISGRVSKSYNNACEAVELLGLNKSRVHIFDSMHLSSGTGILVQYGAVLAECGAYTKEIIAELEKARDRVSTSFITKNIDYLAKSGRVSKRISGLCRRFNLHPVIIVKEGTMKVEKVYIGDYMKAMRRYVEYKLKKTDKINTKAIFITQVAATSAQIDMAKEIIASRVNMEKIYVVDASATVSSNCGPETLGVLFLNNE